MKNKKIVSKTQNIATSIKKQKITLFFQRKALTFFVLKFFLIFGLANLLIELINLNTLTNAIAKVTGGLLGLVVEKSIIFVGENSFLITNSCTGLVSVSILGAIIFALRKPRIEVKMTLFVWGTIALLVINIPRIMLVLFAASKGFNSELVHEITWFLMSAALLFIWFFGTKRITKVKEFSELV